MRGENLNSNTNSKINLEINEEIIENFDKNLENDEKFHNAKISETSENNTLTSKIIKPNIIIIDPPFFKMNLIDLYNCVEFLTKGDKSTKILFAFVHREERGLLAIFKSYNLQLTKFKLEYRHVDQTKWDNYALYSNCEFNKIKFFKNKQFNGNKETKKNQPKPKSSQLKQKK